MEANETGRSFIRKTHAADRASSFFLLFYAKPLRSPSTFVYFMPRREFLFDHVIGKMLLVTLSFVLPVRRFSTWRYPFIAIAVIIFVPHQSSGIDRNDAIE